MKVKIVSDSSSNLLNVEGVEFESVPLKILAGEREYEDNENIDVSEMQAFLHSFKGKSSTSCPNVDNWLKAFGDADIIFAVTLSKNISGSYNAAKIAAGDYMEEHPDRKVYIQDSLSAGPELELIIEKFVELINSDTEFEEICTKMQDYSDNHTHILFSLESLENFARNGRVNPAMATVARVLGICIVGQASDDGHLEPKHKCRGKTKALNTLIECMKEKGFHGGKVRISHSDNLEGAKYVEEQIKKTYPECDITIRKNRGLCSYYAEKGGVLVGYET